jgi:GT2 family glycosyltransferase
MPRGPIAPTESASVTVSAPSAADLDVVVVAYRSRDYVTACLDSLEAARDDLRVEVTVVDNDSVDGTVEAVRSRRPSLGLHATAVPMGTNAGFARASNTGIARGRAPYVLLLNPDTVVGRGSLTSLVRFAQQHPHAGVVAPRLTNPDGSDQLTARAFPTPAAAVFGRRSPLTRWFPRNPWSSRVLAGREASTGTQPFRVDWVSGAAMLVPRRVIEHVGGLDEGFFLFWEDADWCRRIHDAGYEVWCLPSVHVVHDEGGTRRHSWTPVTLRSFHAGAYRYWRKHHAPQPWNPLRWSAAALLTLRAVVLAGRYRLRATKPRHQESR